MSGKKISGIGIKTSVFLFMASLCLAELSPVNAATTLLPNGKQCFTNGNGPLSGGSINMFIPNTTLPKQTWRDPGQLSLNTQPIQLDSAGCAIIYGVGSYRQQVFDGPVVSGATSGALVWDQVTTDPSSYNTSYWAGLSGGTPNAVTVTYPGFSATDGQGIQFLAIGTNTGPATINPSGFAAIPVVKDTSSGPVPLSGGEISAGNVISVSYDLSSNSFHLLNLISAASSSVQPPMCGASGLKIVNTPGLESNKMSITASSATVTALSGAFLTRNNVSASVNTTLVGAGGIEASSSLTANTWYYIWLIDNGITTSAVASTSSTSITLPSGYLYSCRIGSMRTDGSNILYRTQQVGNSVRYVVTASTNTAALRIMATGTAGNISTPTWAAVSVSSYVPPTATRIVGALSTTGGNVVVAAPNSSYGAATSSTNPPPIQVTAYGGNPTSMFDFTLETSNVYWASNSSTSLIAAYGWVDQVNAN